MRALILVVTGLLMLGAGTMLQARRVPQLAAVRPERGSTSSTDEALDRPAVVDPDRVSVSTPALSDQPVMEKDEPTGSCIVRLDVPTSVPLEVSLWTYDVPLDDYARTKHREILPEPLDTRDWTFDPYASADESPIVRSGGRGTSEVVIDGLPLDRALWIEVFSFPWPEGATPAFAPITVPIPRIEEAAQPVVVFARVEALGGIEVHLEPRRHAGPGPVEEQPVLPNVIRDSHGEEGKTEFGHAWIAPLVAGPHDIEVLVEDDASVHRRVFHGIVRDGQMTDVGTWDFDPDETGFDIQAVTEDGEPVMGTFALTGPGWAETVLGNGRTARVSLRGDWSHVVACRFHPGASTLFEDVPVTIASSRPALTTIVVPRRRVRLVDFIALAVLPDGTRDRIAAVAFERIPGASWKPIWLGENCAECSTNGSDKVEPGARELVAWISSRGVSYVGPFLVGSDAAAQDAAPIELNFVETGTAVRGTVHCTCEGLDARADFDMRLRIHGAVSPAAYPVAGRDNFSSHSPFDLRGLPPDIDFELVVTLGDRELAVRPFRLDRAQTLDLGVIEIDVCR
jgi:hypothetical protein